jgi:hypothetical protein
MTAVLQVRESRFFEKLSSGWRPFFIRIENGGACGPRRENGASSPEFFIDGWRFFDLATQARMEPGQLLKISSNFSPV